MVLVRLARGGPAREVPAGAGASVAEVKEEIQVRSPRVPPPATLLLSLLLSPLLPPRSGS